MMTCLCLKVPTITFIGLATVSWAPRILKFGIFILACTFLPGCSLYDTHAPKGYSVELKNNDLLGFYAVRLRQDQNAWRLSGRCYQGGHYQWTNRVVVTVEVLDEHGELVERHCVSTFPERLSHRLDSGLGDFAATLYKMPRAGAVVQVEARGF